MKYRVYKCMECDNEFISNKGDGLSCPKCSGAIAPIRDATTEDKEKIERYVKPSNQKISEKEEIKSNNIVVLRLQSSINFDSIDEMEKKYAEKFGCRVVILEANLQMVDVING